MWDRPDLLNRVADALRAAAWLLVLLGAAHYVIHLPIFPLREVRITQPPRHVAAEEISAVAKGLRGNFFSVDLAATRGAFERLPWVRAATVRRQWPDRLEVVLEEHAPVARWGADGLVDTRGEVFHAAFEGALPVFSGPQGSAKEIAIQYEYFRTSLSSIGRAPVDIHVSARRAWRLRLDDGMLLELGREQVESRVARFVAAYRYTIEPLQRRIEYVDLRYANGFAVRIPGLGAVTPPAKPVKGAA
jgi:cell division protein FtsQ